MRRSLLFAFFLSARALHAEKIEEFFHFDAADETIPVTVLENPLFYDAGVAPATNGLWLTWIEFTPGKGDRLWVGLRQKDQWVFQKPLTNAFHSETAMDFANPTLTFDAKNNLWLTFEMAGKDGFWNVYSQQKTNDTEFGNRHHYSDGPSINHRVTKNPNGGLLMLSQSDFPQASGGFRIDLVGFDQSGSTKHQIFFDAGNRSWHPVPTMTPDGGIHAIWDEYDGTSYNVLYRSELGTNRSAPLVIAGTAGFEAHAQIASDKNGKLYVTWEEDGENWGKHYLARTPGDKQSTRMVDNEGPLHRFRKLHFAELDEEKGELKEYMLPQPSLELATHRTNAPPGLKNFGAFYENSQLVVDGQNRPWIVYRHFYVPWIGLVPETHKQDNMKLYARCLLPGGWSKLYTFSQGQGDGMQRINVAPTPDGIAVAYTIGRTDRRKGEKQSEKKRGVALAEIHLDKEEVKVPEQSSSRLLAPVHLSQIPAGRSRPSVNFNDKKYELFFGDMHRHTDISLCFSPADGTIEDAYRYAIDVAPLDFLGITDHTHDLDMGDGLSLIWHRSRKEVNRHALAGSFIPLFSYERSRGDTDHNVFSLRDDILKPHTYPLTQFWEEIDTNTFTVAHQPFNSITWNYKDDVHRPLLEIYQGFRNDAKEEDAKQALLRGHHVGFIAASDHLSTGGSFACVWAEKAERESLFRALQARRTYAATAPIQLRVTSGEHWMGERFEVKEIPGITVTVKGTDTIAALDFFVDGVIKSTAVDLVQSKKSELTWEIPTDKSLTGPHIFHVRVTQADGNRAWSSPMWIEVK